ncbi:MAG: ABC transporter substrate-binding protein [Halobacteriales archaeon]|nr:ABC transporter substrate-binding protein [Halobacteriales archaeon]
MKIAHSRLDFVDPHNCTDVKEERGVHEALFDSVVTRNRQLEIVPHLAQSWDVSDDARTWRFHLRDDVEFHNGERLDSAAVTYSIERMARPDLGETLGASGVYSQYLGDATVTAEDTETVVITLETPTADLLDILTEAYIVPPGSLDDGWEPAHTRPCGTGPFVFADWEPGDRLLARANESYFKGTPAYDEVVWTVVPEPSQRVARLRSGDVDLISSVPPDAVSTLEESSGTQTVSVRNPTCIIYLFNCRTGPFADHRVRQAANLAVDTDAVIETVIDGAGEPIAGFLSPHHFGYDPDVAPYDYDPDAARELLADAGYGDGVAVRLDSPASYPDEAVELSETVANYLEAVGLAVDINYVEDREAYANMVRRSEIGDLCCFDSSPLSTYRVLQEKLSSERQGAWWQGYDNATVNELLAKASRTTDAATREALYRDCFNIVHDEAPWLFLYNPRNTFGLGGAADGWQPRSDGCAVVGVE